MQADLSSNEPLLDIEIMGVNWAGLESENPQATDGKSIPWLQDVDGGGDGGSDAWSDWGAEHLDLIVLGAHNEPLGKANLVSASLDEQENYSAVRDALVDAAMDSQKPWHNFDNPLDIDGNRVIVPLDALIIVNRLDSIGAGRLPPPGIQTPSTFFDSNGDGNSTSLDVLLVVNFLNDDSTPAAGEGESLAREALPSPESESRLLTVHSSTASTDEVTRPALQHSDSGRTESLVAPSRDDLANQVKTDLVFRAEMVDWVRDIDSHEMALSLAEVL